MFASQMQTLLAHTAIKPTLTQEGVTALSLPADQRCSQAPLLHEIHELNPGHYIVYNGESTIKQELYWQLKAIPHRHDVKQTISTLRDLLKEAHAGMSDVKTRIFTLSPTYTIGFFGENEQASHAQSQRYLIGTDELAEQIQATASGMPHMGEADATMLLFCQYLRTHTHEVVSGEGMEMLFLNNDHPPEEIQQATPILSDDSEETKKTRQLFYYFMNTKLPCILHRTQAMANTADLTVHMLVVDHRLIQYVYNIPWEIKQQLPDSLLPREYQTFPKNNNAAFLQKMQSLLYDLPEDAPVFNIIKATDITTNIAYYLQLNAWLGQYNSY